VAFAPFSENDVMALFVVHLFHVLPAAIMAAVPGWKNAMVPPAAHNSVISPSIGPSALVVPKCGDGAERSATKHAGLTFMGFPDLGPLAVAFTA